MGRITESDLSRTLAPTWCSPTPPVRYPILLNWYWPPHYCILFPDAWRFRKKYVSFNYFIIWDISLLRSD